MATLNQLAVKIANLLRDPHNHELRERIKDSYRWLRAERIRQSIEKYGVDATLKTSYIVPLSKVDSADNCVTTADCVLLRSTNKVAMPIRYNTDDPFTYVGFIDWSTPFIYTDMASLPYMKNLKYIGDAIFYGYENSYLYFNNNTKIKNVRVQAPFADVATAISACDSNGCVTDDMEFPIPEDMLAAIEIEVTKRFGVVAPQSEEINIDKENEAK